MKTENLTRAEAIKALIAGETVINGSGDEIYWDDVSGPRYANREGEAGVWADGTTLRIKPKPRRWVCPDGSHYEEVATFEEAQYAGSKDGRELRRYVAFLFDGSEWATYVAGINRPLEQAEAWVRFVPAT